MRFCFDCRLSVCVRKIAQNLSVDFLAKFGEQLENGPENSRLNVERLESRLEVRVGVRVNVRIRSTVRVPHPLLAGND